MIRLIHYFSYLLIVTALFACEDSKDKDPLPAEAQKAEIMITEKSEFETNTQESVTDSGKVTEISPIEGAMLEGGPCNYVDIPGKAIIQEIKSADPTHNNCKNAVEVLFRFMPNDPTASSRYLHTDWTGPHHMTVGDGKNPPLPWVNELGLRKGVELRAIRSEITQGTCTPVVFVFPDIDMQGYRETCF